MHDLQKFPVKEIATKKIGNDPSKSTIVFLHDSLGCIDIWRDFPEILGEWCDCNIVIYDRQGYGKSCAFSYSERDNGYMELEANFLIELLNYWNLKKVILFGHSDGGSIALIAAGKYPDRVEAVITEGAHIFVEDVTLKGISDAIHAYKTTHLKEKLAKYHGNKTDALFWAWAKTWHTPQFKSWNIEHFLTSITCPALIIQGEEDEYGTLNQVYQSVAGIGDNGHSLVLKNTKHSPHKENREEVLEKVTTFLKEKV